MGQPELTVVVAAVVGVRDHVDALLAGALGHDEVGAARRRRQHEGDAGEAQWCGHGADAPFRGVADNFLEAGVNSAGREGL